MVIHEKGNIFDYSVDAIVNTVNTQGVMGKGLALAFKNKYPSMFIEYQYRCSKSLVKIGKMDVHVLRNYSNADTLVQPHLIINFPTKDHWKDPSKIEYVKSGITDLKKIIKECGITSIAIPPLGAGLGGLNVSDVRTLLESNFSNLDYECKIILLNFD